MSAMSPNTNNKDTNYHTQEEKGNQSNLTVLSDRITQQQAEFHKDDFLSEDEKFLYSEDAFRYIDKAKEESKDEIQINPKKVMSEIAGLLGRTQDSSINRADIKKSLAKKKLSSPSDSLIIINSEDIANLMNIMTNGSGSRQPSYEKLSEEKARLNFIKKENERRAEVRRLKNEQRLEILEKRRRDAELQQQIDDARRAKELAEAERLRALAELNKLKEEKEYREKLANPKAKPKLKEKEIAQAKSIDPLDWKPVETTRGRFEEDNSETFSLNEIEKDRVITDDTII